MRAKALVWLSAALLAAAMPVSAAKAEGDPVGLASESPSQYRLYASEETYDRLGPIRRYLATWAETDLLVASRHDIPIDPGSPDLDGIREIFDEFTKEIPHFPFERSNRSRDLRVMVSRAAASETPAAFPLPASETGERDACIVSLPSLDETDPRRLVADFQNIPVRHLEYLPGTAAEWRLIIIAHEVAHCRHELQLGSHDRVRKLAFELEADQQGIDKYNRYMNRIHWERLQIDKTAVPLALKRLRAVESVLFDRNGHYAVSAGLNLPGMTQPPSTDAARLHHAKMRLQAELWAYASTGVLVASFDGSSSHRPSPASLYRAALSLRDQRYFADDPIERRFLKQFIEGVEAHYPRYFQVDAG